jgi:hypothetical protein
MAEPYVPVSDGQAKHQADVERRARVRLPQSQDIYCQPRTSSAQEAGQTGWLGKLHNISTGGLALILKKRFEPGTVLIVELGVDRAVGSVTVRVVHTTLSTKGRWIIGCEFLRPLSDEEVQALVTG